MFHVNHKLETRMANKDTVPRQAGKAMGAAEAIRRNSIENKRGMNMVILNRYLIKLMNLLVRHVSLRDNSLKSYN